MSTRTRAPSDANRKRRFRETVRDILHRTQVKRQMGEAVDAAGTLAQAMERAYQLGFEEALTNASGTPLKDPPHSEASSDAMAWTEIPPRTRGTFWSICLAALGREGRTETPSYLEFVRTRRGTVAWHLVVPDRQTYDKCVGDGTLATLVRLGLMKKADPATRVMLTDYGIRTWNRFCERGGHWSDDLVDKLP